ncbi:MAG: hypothetical protein WC661_06715 [Opitutaceae bacterium]|jgi:hypothetical protein
MKNIAIKYVFAGLIIGLCPMIARSQTTLANYNFTSASVASTVSVGGVAASTFTSPKSYFNFSSSNGTAYVFPTTVVNGSGGTSAYSTTVADAIANNRYFQFTITPDSGNQVALSALSFNYGAITASGSFPQAGAPITVAFEVRSSVDNFTTSIGSVSASFNQSENNVTGLYTINLTSISGYSLLTTATTFRIYAYFSSGTPGYSDSSRLDNVSLTGTVSAIPEPSAYAAGMGVIALCGAVAFSRRRRGTA